MQIRAIVPSCLRDGTLICGKISCVTVEVGKDHMRYRQRRRVAALPSAFHGFLGDHRVTRHLGPGGVRRGEAAPRPEISRVVRMVAQKRKRALPGPSGLDCGVAIRHRASRAAADLQIEFKPIAFGTGFHALQHVDAAGELHRRFLRR